MCASSRASRGRTEEASSGRHSRQLASTIACHINKLMTQQFKSIPGATPSPVNGTCEHLLFKQSCARIIYHLVVICISYSSIRLHSPPRGLLGLITHKLNDKWRSPILRLVLSRKLQSWSRLKDNTIPNSCNSLSKRLKCCFNFVYISQARKLRKLVKVSTSLWITRFLQI